MFVEFSGNDGLMTMCMLENSLVVGSFSFHSGTRLKDPVT